MLSVRTYFNYRNSQEKLAEKTMKEIKKYNKEGAKMWRSNRYMEALICYKLVLDKLEELLCAKKRCTKDQMMKAIEMKNVLNHRIRFLEDFLRQEEEKKVYEEIDDDFYESSDDKDEEVVNLLKKMEAITKANISEFTPEYMVGYRKVIKTLSDVFTCILNEDDLPLQYFFEEMKFALLYGPPGTGKTSIAKAVANISGASFLHVRPSRLKKSEGNDEYDIVKVLFEVARQNSPTVLFLDDIEELLPQKSFMQRRCEPNLTFDILKNVILSQDIFVIASSTNPWKIDGAFLKSVPLKQYIGLPNKRERRLLFDKFVEDFPSNLTDREVAVLAQVTKNYSREDLKLLTMLVKSYPVQRLVDSEYFRFSRSCDRWVPCSSRAEGAKRRPVTAFSPSEVMPLPLEWNDLISAVQIVKPKITSLGKKYETSMKKYRTKNSAFEKSSKSLP